MTGNQSQWRRWLQYLWTGSNEVQEREQSLTDSQIYQQIYSIPGVEEYKRAADRTQLQALLIAALFGILLGVLYTFMRLDNIAAPIVALCLVALPILLWHFPSFSLYFTLAVCCLIEVNSRQNIPDALTDHVPLWWSLNWLMSYYANFNPGVLPVNTFEIVLLFIALTNLLRMVYLGNLSFRKGDLFYPILTYLFFVIIALINGLLTGGEFEISLLEVRSQVYMLLGFCMAVNLIENRRQVRAAFWLAAICIAIKGILYTYRQYVTFAGRPLDPQGVGSHEEAFFFSVFLAMLVIFTFTKTHLKLRWFMWIMVPMVILGNIATNRRAGTAAIIVAAPVMVAGCYAAYPRNRKLIIGLAATGAALAYPYYQVFKNSPSAIAQPARAVRSHYEPDARDLSSNQYRDAENYNQYSTIRQYPFGYGYGKPFLMAVPMADISKSYPLWNILPHNQILWVWMRTGTFGYIAFWIMISQMIIRCVFFVRRNDLTNEDRAMALVALTVIPMLLMFGLYDLQLTNYRDILMTFLIVGMTCARIKEIPAWDWRKGPGEEIMPMGTAPEARS